MFLPPPFLQLSEYNLTDRADGQLVVGVCTDTIEHPDWTGEVRDGNDIAIVKLCKPIIYSEVSAGINRFYYHQKDSTM